jgi:creatinine amidohydrolase
MAGPVNHYISTATSADALSQDAKIAVLPVGSFEQHGDYLPLTTDTIVASLIARKVSDDYKLFLLPPVTLGCSHEHAAFAGTVSVSAATVTAVISDVRESLAAQGIDTLVIANGHGGNHFLANVVIQANTVRRCMTLFPTREDWDQARLDSGCTSNHSEDMHAGELEVSLLLHADPALVRDGYQKSDHLAWPRPFLLVTGMKGYTETGVIGLPSEGTPEKGKEILDSLSRSFAAHAELLGHPAR